MLNTRTLFMFCIISAALTETWSDNLNFPPGFKFGAATSAYQIEGAWNVSDKGLSIWDKFSHDHPEAMANRSNGDVACDSYHLWRRDVEMAIETGLDFYRFSISWSRLLPNGFSNKISEDGKRYYTGLIDELLSNGIEPFVTLHHFNMPQKLQDLGGWANPLIVDWFTDYARVVFTLFGHKVKTWMTINEPFILCEGFYTEAYAPGILDSDIGRFLCSKNVLLAHAKVWRLYDEEYKPKFGGKISIGNAYTWFEPATPYDERNTQLAREYWNGRFAHPIYSKQGGWSPVLQGFLDDLSTEKGYNKSILPAFTQEEVELVKGTFDYHAVNHYTSYTIRGEKQITQIQDEEIPFIYASSGLQILLGRRTDWQPIGDSPRSFYPRGLRNLISSFRDQYGNMEFLVTENGYYDKCQGLEDDARITHIHDFLKEILFLINEDNITVTGYTYWSLMDNLEYQAGYGPKYGLYGSPNRCRTARKSARFYSRVIETKQLIEVTD